MSYHKQVDSCHHGCTCAIKICSLGLQPGSGLARHSRVSAGVRRKRRKRSDILGSLVQYSGGALEIVLELVKLSCTLVQVWREAATQMAGV